MTKCQFRVPATLPVNVITVGESITLAKFTHNWLVNTKGLNIDQIHSLKIEEQHPYCQVYQDFTNHWFGVRVQLWRQIQVELTPFSFALSVLSLLWLTLFRMVLLMVTDDCD